MPQTRVPLFARLAIGLLAASSLAAPLLPLRASAQAAIARPTGDVRGLDLQLEGSLTGLRGGTLSWSVVSYEVRGLERLALAPGVELELSTSIAPTAEPLVTRTDAHGRAVLSLPIPIDAPDTFQVALRASRGSVQRRFELPIQTRVDRALEVVSLSREIGPAGQVDFYVSMTSASGAPIERAQVRVDVLDGAARPLLAPLALSTDGAGLAYGSVRLPREAAGQSVMLRARSGEGPSRVEHATFVDQAQSARDDGLRVAVAPERWVVRPGETIQVDVVVRTANGRPVEGAIVASSARSTGAFAGEAPPLRTDARGRARFPLLVRASSEAFSNLTIPVHASHEREGAGDSVSVVRVARVARFGAFAIEGGALSPSIGGRLYVRAVEADGEPTGAGVEVSIEGPRIGAHTARTDGNGVAVFEVPALSALTPSVIDRCGEGVATAVRIAIAEAEPLEACVDLDPHAALRIRLAGPRVRPGAAASFELARAPSARALPVSVRVFEAPSGRLLGGVVLERTESRGALMIPPSASGRLVFVARALFGPDEREARGGSVQAWVERAGAEQGPGAAGSIEGALRLERAADGLHVRAPRAPGASAIFAAYPVEEIGIASNAPDLSWGALQVPTRTSFEATTDAMLEAALAVSCTRDASAPFELRTSGGRVEAVARPAAEGGGSLLRDPWRASARFVTGRLALLFQAVEDSVTAAVPGRLDDVAVVTNGRFEFNAQILEAAVESASLGAEGARDLGGEPITVEALRALDPAFTYDHVARRVTRQRLFRIFVALRRFILDNGYDIPWARVGDASAWLSSLTQVADPATGRLEPRDLVDGWGRPFVLAEVRGRARFAAWQPLPGWELFSSGPDGRANTGDDLVDPTARVLPRGSAYADAVDEELLLARLSGIELGRATLADLGQRAGVRSGSLSASSERASTELALARWSRLPPRFVAPLAPLALVRSGRGVGVVSRAAPLDGRDVVLPLDEDPRTWEVAMIARDGAGTMSARRAITRFGSDLLVEGELPRRVRVGERVEVELVATNLDTEPRTYALAAGVTPEERGAPEPIALVAPPSISLAPEASERLVVRLEGRAPGEASASLRWLDGERVVRTLRTRHAVDRGLHPIRRRAAFLSSAGLDVSVPLEAREGALDTRARVVVLRPSSLALDPDLARARESDPALVAWALRTTGHALDPALEVALDRLEPTTSSSTTQARAIVALAAADLEDEEAVTRLETWRRAFAQRSSADAAESIRIVAALAYGGIDDLATLSTEGGADPVALRASRERNRVRRVLAEHPAEWSLLARASAALLLADPGDAHGRAMFERARAHVASIDVNGRGARALVPPEGGDRPLERLVGSLALSLAARQLGDVSLADELLSFVVSQENVLLRAGGEATFWWLALGTYTQGTSTRGTPGASDELRVSVDGRTIPATLEGGAAVISLDGATARSTISIRADGPVFARAEALSYAPYAAQQGAPVTLSIEGDPGDLEHMSTLRLSVSAEAEVRGLRLSIQIPAGARVLPERFGVVRGAAGGDEEPARATLRAPGVLELRIPRIERGVEVAVPLPLSWMARGTVRGLAVVAYEEDAPDRMTVLPARELVIR